MAILQPDSADKDVEGPQRCLKTRQRKLTYKGNHGTRPNFRNWAKPRSPVSIEELHARSQDISGISRKRKKSPSQQTQSNFRQKQRRRRQGIFRKAVEYSLQKYADVYILIHINDQYFDLNTDPSGFWPPPETQIDKYYPQTIRKTPEEYLSLTKKKLGRRDTLFKKIVQYSGECRADVQIIVYENNRYFTLYTNGDPPPSAEQLKNHYPLPVHNLPSDIN